MQLARIISSLLFRPPFSTTSTTTLINTISRILSDHRSPSSDLESVLLPYTSHLTPPLLDHLLRCCVHLPLPCHRLFILLLSSSSSSYLSHSPLSFLTLLHPLSSHRLFPLSWSLLHDHQPLLSSKPFHILISSYSKSNLPLSAINTFQRIPEFNNLSTTTSDLGLLLYSLCHHGHVQQAQHFHQVKSDFKVTLKTYSILIANSIPKDAVTLFDEMRGRAGGEFIDVAAYNALLGSLCKGGEVAEAERRFKEMRVVYGLEPDAGRYGVFVRAYCVAEDEGAAVRMVENARRKGVVLNVFTFNCLVKLLCEKGRVEEAYELVDKMVAGGAKPDAWSYNRIMAVHCRLHEVNKALRILRRMDGDGCLSDRHTYNMLLKMLVGVGRMDWAEEVWDGMGGRGFYPGVCSYAVMIHGLCKKKGGAKEACRYFEVMVDEGIPPYDSTCMLLRAELVRLGLSEMVLVLTDKMRRSSSCTIQELSSVMENGKKLDKKQDVVTGT